MVRRTQRRGVRTVQQPDGARAQLRARGERPGRDRPGDGLRHGPRRAVACPARRRARRRRPPEPQHRRGVAGRSRPDDRGAGRRDLGTPRRAAPGGPAVAGRRPGDREEPRRTDPGGRGSTAPPAELVRRYGPEQLAVFTDEEVERFLGPVGGPSAPWEVAGPAVAWELLYRIDPALYERLVAGERMHPGVLAWLPDRVACAVEVG